MGRYVHGYNALDVSKVTVVGGRVLDWRLTLASKWLPGVGNTINWTGADAPF